MQKINDLFDQEITKTVDAYPSIFSKDDVVNLLSSLRTEVLAIKESNMAVITDEQFQNFSEAVTRQLSNNINNGELILVEEDSIDLTISYNKQIEIDNVEVNTDRLEDDLHDILLTKFEEAFADFLEK